jgi:hypothetical protein
MIILNSEIIILKKHLKAKLTSSNCAVGLRQVNPIFFSKRGARPGELPAYQSKVDNLFWHLVRWIKSCTPL